MKNRKFWHWIKNDAGESDTADISTVRTLYLNGVIAEESWFDDEIPLTDPTIKGKLGVNAMRAKKHLYDHVVYDSDKERKFASDLNVDDKVSVYVKLPHGFFISTPVGKYNPDWAIAFYENNVKHIYFVAETKGSMDTLQFEDFRSDLERAKNHCAEEHFRAISGEGVVYGVVDSYAELMEKVMR